MLHVLHVDTGRGWRGGQAQVLGLLQALHGESGLRQTLCSPPRAPLTQRAVQMGLEGWEFPLRGEWDFASSLKLRQRILGEGVDIVHTHDAHAHTIGMRAIRRARHIKLVVHRRVDFPVGRGWLGRGKYGPRVDHFVAISRGVADVLGRCGVPPEKVTVIPSGVDSSKFDGVERTGALRCDLGIEAGAPLIGTVGHLVDHKGHRFLIDAMPLVLTAHPEVRCVIVGEGELRGALERQIRDCGLEGKVLLAGWRDDIGACLAEFKVFCLPSHLEGLCTSLLDATLFSLPLVACDTGGVPEIVRAGETGWLVAPRDPGALAIAVSEALSEPEEARRRAEAARRRTVNEFSLTKTAQKTLALWRRLVADGSL